MNQNEGRSMKIKINQVGVRSKKILIRINQDEVIIIELDDINQNKPGRIQIKEDQNEPGRIKIKEDQNEPGWIKIKED